jgi:hypothetical protein
VVVPVGAIVEGGQKISNVIEERAVSALIELLMT